MPDTIANETLVGSEIAAAEIGRLLRRFRATSRTGTSRFALFCAAASKGAYEPKNSPWNRALSKLGFDIDHRDDRSTNTQFHLLESNEALFVAFRGTKEFADIFRDLNTRFYRRGTTNVHAGFWTAIRSVWEGPTNFSSALVKAHRARKPIVLTGHSLGGALAFLAACRAETDRIPVSRVLTFGQPHVGAEDFVSKYSRTISATTRFVNAGDIVTLLPNKAIIKLGSSGPRGRRTKRKKYMHDAGAEFYIRQDGSHEPAPRRRGLRGRNAKNALHNIRKVFMPTMMYHQMSRYYDHVKSNAAAIDKHLADVL